jgi:hypothetical protein
MKTPMDETLLSAYVDGELAPDDHARIANALQADSELAAVAKAVQETKGIVLSLPRRNAPAGFSDSVLARIEADRRRPLIFRRPARVLAFGVTLAAAASVWVGMIILRPERIGSGPSLTDAVVQPAFSPHEEISVVASEAQPPSRVELPAHLFAGDDPPLLANGEGVLAAREKARSEAFTHALLTHPASVKVELNLSPDQLDALSDAVARSARREPEFGRINLPPDSIGAAPAAVIALVADGTELDHLLRQIRHRFGEQSVRRESSVDPGLARRVCETGPFLVATSAHAGLLMNPLTEVIASKAEADPGLPPPHEPIGHNTTRNEPPRDTARRPDGQLIVLLWVD